MNFFRNVIPFIGTLGMLMSVFVLVSCENDQVLTYKDPSKPIDERVTDLLSRMTLKEKILQLNQAI